MGARVIFRTETKYITTEHVITIMKFVILLLAVLSVADSRVVRRDDDEAPCNGVSLLAQCLQLSDQQVADIQKEAQAIMAAANAKGMNFDMDKTCTEWSSVSECFNDKLDECNDAHGNLAFFSKGLDYSCSDDGKADAAAAASSLCVTGADGGKKFFALWNALFKDECNQRTATTCDQEEVANNCAAELYKTHCGEAQGKIAQKYADIREETCEDETDD